MDQIVKKKKNAPEKLCLSPSLAKREILSDPAKTVLLGPDVNRWEDATTRGD